MRKKVVIFLLTVLSLFPALGYAQGAPAFKISGNVIDRNTGEPLIGVSIRIEGKSVGTTTGVNGEFSIQAQKGETIKASFIGYLSQDIKVKNDNFLRIYMEENAQEIGEVVVVGVAMKKSDLTGSVARVGAAELKELPTANVNQALQGKVPGVYIESNPKPGTKASIKIRGNNSIQYGTDPIFVVDGLVMDGGFELLNPDDIATIDVLKDASATAIYGSRGANGVVLITTKKGKKGSARVTYDAWFGFQDFSKKMPMLSANELFDLRVDAYANVYSDKYPTRDREAYIKNSLITENAKRNVAFSETELNSYKNGETYNWLDEVTRSGFQQNHAVSFSGGNDTGNYFLSFNYNNQQGQVRNTGYDRYSGKVNLEQLIKPWLKVGTNNTYVFAKEKPVGDDNTFINALKASPLYPISEEPWYMMSGKTENQSASNPLRDMYIDKDYYRNRLMSSSYVNINPIKGLDIRSTFSIDVDQMEEFTYYPTNSTQSYKGSYNGQSIQKKQRNLNWQWDNTVSYNNTFAEKHRIGAMAGMNMSYYSYNYNQQNASGYGNDLFSYKYTGGATDKENFALSSDFVTYSLMSYFMRLNYTYDSRYYLTLTGRFDGSSKFGTENKWGFFPSVAASWNITEESFMEDQHVVNNLRLRVGYGTAGNQNIPNYSYYTRYSPSSSLGSSILTNDGMYGNPGLRWEKQGQFNVGLDFGAWNNRVSFALDYFNIKNEDLLMEISKPASTGYLKEISNVGAMKNEGVEFSLNVTPVQTKDFTWDVSFNIASSHNKVTRLDGKMKEKYKLGGWSNNEIQREGNLFVGESINNIYVYKFDRIVQESDMDYVNSLDLGGRIVKPGDILPLDANHDNIINDKDRRVVGKKDPDFYGGLQTTLSYKGFSLNVVATYSVGAKRNSYLYETLMNSTGLDGTHKDMLNRWTPTNTNTDIPRAYSESGRFGIGEVDWAVQDASFFRLSAVTLSYTFPRAWMKQVYAENLRLYVTGNNLVTATKYKGFDPESGDWYPSSRMWVVGVNLSF